MKDFRQLVSDDQYTLVNYLQQNEMECPELYDRFQSYGLDRQPGNRKSGYFYGYFEEAVLKGVFFFGNNHIFMCHYESSRILDRVVLLKAIKHYRPKLFIGAEEYINPIWEMIRKTLADCNYYESYFMSCSNILDSLSPGIEVKDSTQLKNEEIVAFWMEVEKAFGRPVTMVHQLKEKLVQQALESKHLYVEEQGRIVAQGVVEFSTKQFVQLGGIYVNPDYRQKGYAEAVVKQLSKNAIEAGKIPVLIVEKKNKAAVALYKKIGYKAVYKHITLEVKYQ